MVIYGKLVCNQHAISEYSKESIGKTIGKGLYLDASIVDHSCAPNATWFHRGKEQLFKTIEDVENFSDLRISYLGQLNENTEKRRELLMNSKFFHCECRKCLDVPRDQLKSSLICSQCGECVSTMNGKCKSCKLELEPMLIKKHKVMKDHFKITQNDKKIQDIQIYENEFDQAVRIFHPYDNDFYQFLIKTLNVFKMRFHETNCLNSRVLKIVELKLINQYQNFPFYTSDNAIIELEAVSICLALNDFEKAESHFLKAKEILKIDPGDDHPFVINKLRQVQQFILDAKRKAEK